MQVATLRNPVQPLVRDELADRTNLLEGPFADGGSPRDARTGEVLRVIALA